MSLVEENLPGVGRVKKDFQVREDHVIAKQLQEREYEEHFDANVQSRRTAMKDAQVAKSFQASEMNSFKQEEGIRREQLRQQEERDREAAERYVQSIQEQEQRDVEARRKDEEVVQRLHREEMEREAQRRRQEEEDNRLALQHAQENEAIAKRRQEELARGEQEAKRLQQMEATKKPSGGAGLPSYESLGFSLPPPLPPQPDEQEEEYVDESGQQEEEDARLAREMMEREEREAQRRRREQELADIEMARRLQQMESKGGAAAKPKTTPTSDADIARRMELEAREQQRRMNAQLQADEELAQRMRSDLIRQHSEQEMTDWELAKKLQKAEIVAHKKAAQTRGGGAGGGAMHSSFSHSSHPSTNSPTQSLPATLTANGQHRSQDGATVRPVYEDRPSDSPRGVQAYKRQLSAGKEGKKGKGKK